MDIFAQSLGLVQEGDTLSLSPGLELYRYTLVDTASGARHKVSRSAYHTLDLLRYPISIELWLQSGAVQNLQKKQAIKLLLLVDQLSGLTVTRSRMQGISLRVRRLLSSAKGMPLSHNLERYPATIVNLVRLMVHTYKLLGLTIFFVAVLMYGANMPVSDYLISQGVFLLVLFSSSIVHEIVHWWLLGQARRDVVFVRRGLRIGVLCPAQTDSREFRSAIYGPLSGLLSGVGISIGFYVLSGNVEILLSGIIAGSFHVVSWLPMYGDGKTLVSKWAVRYA